MRENNEGWMPKNRCFLIVVLEKTLESSLDFKEIKPVHPKRKSVLNIHWKDWCWSSNTLATWCEELTHWKTPWCWERLRAGGKGDDREWDDWMAQPTQRTWVWASSGRYWRTRKPDVLQSMGLQRVRHDWVTEQQQIIVLLRISFFRSDNNCFVYFGAPVLKALTFINVFLLDWFL